MKDEAMPGSIFGVEVSEESLTRQAEIMALRQITDSLRVINTELKEGRDRHERVLAGMADIKQDIAVMKEQNRAVEDIRETQQAHNSRIAALEVRQQQIDGATNLVKWLREFGPWLFSLCVLAWSLFGKVTTK